VPVAGFSGISPYHVDRPSKLGEDSTDKLFVELIVVLQRRPLRDYDCRQTGRRSIATIVDTT
jgi:hypothetical protein